MSMTNYVIAFIFVCTFLIFIIKCGDDESFSNKTNTDIRFIESTATNDLTIDIIVDKTSENKMGDAAKNKIDIYKSYKRNYDNLSKFDHLINKLIKDDYAREYLELLFTCKNVDFIKSAINVNLGYKSEIVDMNKYGMSKLSPVFSKGKVDSAGDFIRVYKKVLNKANKEYKIPVAILTSIIWVESIFGRDFGIHNVFSVYASMSVYLDDEAIKSKIDELKRKYKVDADSLTERIKVKAEWAYGELKSLLRIDKETEINIVELRGSWAGAFGFPQFIPSSYIGYAVDGNDDDEIDLFNIEDSIMSVANYLYSAGWNNDKQKTQINSILAYNHSVPYLVSVVSRAKSLNPTYKLDISYYISMLSKDNKTHKKTKSLNEKHKETIKKELKRQILLNNMLQ